MERMKNDSVTLKMGTNKVKENCELRMRKSEMNLDIATQGQSYQRHIRRKCYRVLVRYKFALGISIKVILSLSGPVKLPR